MFSLQEFIAQAPCGMARGMEDGVRLRGKGAPIRRSRQPFFTAPGCPAVDLRRLNWPSCPGGYKTRTDGGRLPLYLIYGRPELRKTSGYVLYSRRIVCGRQRQRGKHITVQTLPERRCRGRNLQPPCGILGFLDFSFVHSDFHANCGLLDVLEALRWVRNEYSRLRGDPDNVTVFGQSAGGRSQACFPCSPAARGLFSNVS